MTPGPFCTLVATVGSGEMFISRSNGITRLHREYASGGRSEISEEEAERAIVRAGMRRMDEDFASWQELGARVEAIAAELAPAVNAILARPPSIGDVEAMIRAGERWLDAGEGARVRMLARRMLAFDVTRTSSELYARVLALLDRAEKPAPPAALRSAEAHSRFLGGQAA